MSRPNQRDKTRVEQVAEHLLSRGHISEGSALIEYGRFRLGAAIHRLRTDRADLIADGFEIVTIHKQDTKGDRYGEYHLVQTAAAESRRQLEDQRHRSARRALRERAVEAAGL